jgi:hypothetical protein
MLNEEKSGNAELFGNSLLKKPDICPWWRGAVVIASASGIRIPGFEARHGIRL